MSGSSRHHHSHAPSSPKTPPSPNTQHVIQLSLQDSLSTITPPISPLSPLKRKRHDSPDLDSRDHSRRRTLRRLRDKNINLNDFITNDDEDEEFRRALQMSLEESQKSAMEGTCGALSQYHQELASVDDSKRTNDVYVPDLFRNPSGSNVPAERNVNTQFAGLRNLGNTCSLNALIQFMAFSPLREYILDFIWDEGNASPEMILQRLFGRDMSNVIREVMPVQSDGDTTTPNLTTTTTTTHPQTPTHSTITTSSTNHPPTTNGKDTPHLLQELRLLFLEMLLSPADYIEPRNFIKNIPRRAENKQEDLVEMWECIRDVLEEQLAAEGQEHAHRFQKLLYGETQEFEPEATGAFAKDAFQVLRLPINESTHSIMDSLHIIAKPAYTPGDDPGTNNRTTATDDDPPSQSEHIRQLFFSKLPPALMLQMHRVRFDKDQNDITKTTRQITYPTTLYLDEFHVDNRVLVKRMEAEIQHLRTKIDLIEQRLRVPDAFEEGSNLIQAFNHVLWYLNKFCKSHDLCSTTEDDLKRELHSLQQKKLELETERIRLQGQIDDMSSKIPNEYEYQLHAVFMHSGVANHGHYWVYLRNCKPTPQNENTGYVGIGPQKPSLSSFEWICLNDSQVSGVSQAEVLSPEGGDCYLLVYLRNNLLQNAKSLPVSVSSVPLPEVVRQELFKEKAERIRGGTPYPLSSPTNVITIDDSEDDATTAMTATPASIAEIQAKTDPVANCPPFPPHLQFQEDKLTYFGEQFQRLTRVFTMEAEVSTWFFAYHVLHFETYLLKLDEEALFHWTLADRLFKHLFQKKINDLDPEQRVILHRYLPDNLLRESEGFADLLGFREESHRLLQRVFTLTEMALASMKEKLTSKCAQLLLDVLEMDRTLPSVIRSPYHEFLLDLCIMDMIERARENDGMTAYAKRMLKEAVACASHRDRKAMLAYAQQTIDALRLKYHSSDDVAFFDSLLKHNKQYHSLPHNKEAEEIPNSFSGDVVKLFENREDVFRFLCESFAERGVRMWMFLEEQKGKFQEQVPQEFWTAKTVQARKRMLEEQKL